MMATKTPKEIHVRRMSAPLQEADAKEVLARVNTDLRGTLYPREGLRHAIDCFGFAAVEALKRTSYASGMLDEQWAGLVSQLFSSGRLRPRKDMNDAEFEVFAHHVDDMWWPQSARSWAKNLLQKAALAEELEARGGDASAIVDDLPRLQRWAKILRETHAAREEIWLRRLRTPLQPIDVHDLRFALVGRAPEREYAKFADGTGLVKLPGLRSAPAGVLRRKAENALDALKAAIDLVKAEWERLAAVVDIEEGKVPRPAVSGGRKKRGPQEGLGRKAEGLIANALHNECDPPWEPAEIAALFRAMMLPEPYDPGDNHELLTKEEAERLNIRLEQLSKPDGVKNILWP